MLRAVQMIRIRGSSGLSPARVESSRRVAQRAGKFGGAGHRDVWLVDQGAVDKAGEPGGKVRVAVANGNRIPLQHSHDRILTATIPAQPNDTAPN